MHRSPRPHDLLWLQPGADLACGGPLPPWAEQRLSQRLPVVVRRAPWTRGRVPAGIRGELRSQRLALLLEPHGVDRVLAPEALRGRVPQADRAGLAVFRTLTLLAGLLPGDLVWGPTGSAGFELATGWPTVTGSSDLDLVLRCPEPLGRTTARAWVEACTGLPARCDLQLDTGRGGCSLLEWALGRAEILVKTDEGPLLVGDPWSVPPPGAP